MKNSLLSDSEKSSSICVTALHVRLSPLEDSSLRSEWQIFLIFWFVPHQTYFRFNEVFTPAHCRGGYYFFLDKKAAKNQDGKNLLPARPTSRPGFPSGLCALGWLAHSPNCHCEERSNLFAIQSELTSGMLAVAWDIWVIGTKIVKNRYIYF